MSVALHDHNLNHRGGWLVGFVALLCFAVLLLITILHDTIRVFKLLIVEYINVHTLTITAIVRSVPIDGWRLSVLRSATSSESKDES